MTLQALMANTHDPSSTRRTPSSNSTAGQHFYCWSHGLSTNSEHTSATCTSPADGHQAAANLNDMMGGNTTIKRRRGERSVFRRADRPDRRPAQGQNQGPGR